MTIRNLFEPYRQFHSDFILYLEWQFVLPLCDQHLMQNINHVVLNIWFIGIVFEARGRSYVSTANQISLNVDYWDFGKTGSFVLHRIVTYLYCSLLHWMRQLKSSNAESLQYYELMVIYRSTELVLGNIQRGPKNVLTHW
jgi:hypothetical protein